jgi:hypothetical protein
MFSIFIGGGQDYYGPTAERDKKVVRILATKLREDDRPFQLVTGGTDGIPDEMAKIVSSGHNKTTIDILSEKYVPTYKERLVNRPRAYWIAGKTQEERRNALAACTDIRVALFIQGGPYTAHEILLFQRAQHCQLVIFNGSGGASGGEITHQGERYEQPIRGIRAYDSTDPDADPEEIAQHLYEDIFRN